MYTEHVKSKTSIFVGFLITLLVALSGTSKYGGSEITRVFVEIWNDWWILIVVMFVIGFIMTVFNPPDFIRKLFGMKM